MHNLFPIEEFRLTNHAIFEMARRRISENDIARVLHAPEQAEHIQPGRAVYQSRLYIGEPPKTFLLRIFIDIDREPPAVVTVYLTSKIEKYWRK